MRWAQVSFGVWCLTLGDCQLVFHCTFLLSHEQCMPFHFLQPCQRVLLSDFDYRRPRGCEVVSLCGSDLHFPPMTRDVVGNPFRRFCFCPLLFLFFSTLKGWFQGRAWVISVQLAPPITKYGNISVQQMTLPWAWWSSSSSQVCGCMCVYAHVCMPMPTHLFIQWSSIKIGFFLLQDSPMIPDIHNLFYVLFFCLFHCWFSIVYVSNH